MDNLTHSLIGAVLGQAGLKRKTGLAMPALIIGANLPDVDAPWAFHPEGLAIRRGITHGPIALVLLPLILWGALLLFERWQVRRGKRPAARLPVRRGWLLALCYLGCLTHPLFDWMNSYGIRLLEPFSHQWFYGDVLFIIDPWIWAMLGAGVWLSRRRERQERPSWRRPAMLAIIAVMAFVSLNLALSRLATSVVRGSRYAEKVANPVPVAFWKRDMLWRGVNNGRDIWPPVGIFGLAKFRLGVPGWTDDEAFIPTSIEGFTPTNMDDPRIALWSQNNPAARAFLFWSRMPVAELHEDRIILRDQRFMDRRTAGQFSVTLRPPKQ